MHCVTTSFSILMSLRPRPLRQLNQMLMHHYLSVNLTNQRQMKTVPTQRLEVEVNSCIALSYQM